MLTSLAAPGDTLEEPTSLGPGTQGDGGDQGKRRVLTHDRHLQPARPHPGRKHLDTGLLPRPLRLGVPRTELPRGGSQSTRWPWGGDGVRDRAGGQKPPPVLWTVAPAGEFGRVVVRDGES